MRFSEQRASVGGSGKTEAGLTDRVAQHPTQKLFVTPRMEVDTLCRLALLRYLESCGADLAEVATAHLAREEDALPGGDRYVPRLRVEVPSFSPLPLCGGGARGGGATWPRLKSALECIKIVDPACGEAHMLIGMLDLLDGLLQQADRELGIVRPHQARRLAIAQTSLFGVEAQRGTLARAQQCLVTAVWGPNSTIAAAIWPNLIHADSLVEREEFHWSERFRHVMSAGGFHVVLGNPPYVRHEHIADPLNRLSAEAYKDEAFTAAHARLDAYLDSMPVGEAPITLSRRSDLSLLFAVFGLTLLRPGGVLGFVLPSAVLSAQYGESLWRFLSSADLDSQLVENRSRRTFVDAGVNTVLLLVARRCQPGATVSQPELAPVAGEVPGGPVPINQRTHTISPPLLCLCPAGYGGGVRGGGARPASRLQTGSSLIRLRRRIEEHCISLGSIGRLRYPIKTGLNCFFYPNLETRARFRIEPAFLVPIVKSPRDVRNVIVTREAVSAVLFHCPRSTAQLRQEGAIGALAYISWGAAQTRPSGRDSAHTLVPWPAVPSLRGRDPWYAVPLPNPAHILCPRFLHRRFFFALPADGILEDQTFYGLELALDIQDQHLLVGALLNSSLAYLMMETHGRTGLGDGVRQYALRDMADLPIPNMKRVDASVVPELTRVFGRLASRPILAIEEEVGRPDRIQLDALVCASIGLSEAGGADARRYLTSLVNQRLDRAKCR